MADNFSLKSPLSLTIFFCILASATTEQATSLNPKTLALRKEKLTHIRVYFQERRSGPNPTVVTVVPPQKNNSLNQFGSIGIMDNALTIANETSSTMVGRAQGLYAFAANTENEAEMALIMMMNFVFTQGKYNGSTISIFGRNVGSDPVREMPIVGGTGHFRFARGFSRLRTTAEVERLTVRHDMYVLHY